LLIRSDTTEGTEADGVGEADGDGDKEADGVGEADGDRLLNWKRKR
jgi:hypothetical protein